MTTQPSSSAISTTLSAIVPATPQDAIYDPLAGLNAQQCQAVTTTEGYVRVIAGAGSGKTRALTHRYAYLVNELGIATSGILCVTFTNKAAYEMKRRIRRMIGDQDTGLICTFHGFCVQVLREDIHTMHYPAGFLVLDDEDTDAILRDIYKDARIDSKRYTFAMAKEMIAGRKEKMEHIPYILNLENGQLYDKYLNSEKTEDRLFFGYLYQQKKCFGLDYDDLITFVYYILGHFPEKCDKWQRRLEYIMVDEFQDVSAMQYGLADILSGYHRNLFIVGDPDQTIYTWRGASVGYILEFDKKHEDTQTVVMDVNYRSTQSILNAANALIRKNEKRIDKELKAIRPEGERVLYHHAKTAEEEAKWIAGQIGALRDAGERLNQMTILYRSHYVSRSLEEVFVKEKIPYVLYSGVEFYKRKEIKDVLSYLRMVANGDDLSFLRVINEPRRNMGTKRMALLKEYAGSHGCTLYEALKENLEQPLIEKSGAGKFVEMIELYRSRKGDMKVTDLLASILDVSGYEAMLRTGGEGERLDNIAELKRAIFDFEHGAGEETTLEEYLQSVALFTNGDKEEWPDCVKMMTIHTAKGLEFPNVFLCGLSEGIFPTKHVDSLEGLEEERRLAYVAYTRAENRLYLSDSEGVNYDGSFRYPSRFLFDTGREHLEYTAELPSQLAGEAMSYIRMSESRMHRGDQQVFLVGDRVRHKVFGEGEILAVGEPKDCYTIQFDGARTSRSINMRIPLERVDDIV